MTNKRLNTKDLVDKIEKMAKSRIASQPIVSLDQFRSAEKNLHPKTLLIIEDDSSMREALKRMFDSSGYTLKVAADVTELGKFLDDSPIDLILLDVGLPWVNGFELAQLLKEHRDLKSIPLVFMSGSATDEDIQKAKDLGADDFVRKPFDVQMLLKKIESLLQRD